MTTTTKAAAPEKLRKLTLTTMGFDQATITQLLGDSKAIDLARIVGQTTDAIPGQTPLGEYLKLKGEFKGINLHTGEIFDSATALLPNFIAEEIAHALKSTEQVTFGILVGVKANPKSVTKYEFTVRPLVQAAPSDAMAKLMAQAGFDEPLALEAPKPAKTTKGAK